MSLSDPGRLDALARTGLGAAPDEMFDRFADLVRRVLGVPVALVSLVSDERQFLPGAFGLAEPWMTRRETTLSHAFCQPVVLSAEPLVVTDARTDPRVTGHLAIEDLNVIGYAGMPLTDAEGRVLGALCAIDDESHAWTEEELALLSDLAAACSDSLRLRIATRRAGAAFDRSQLLLRASTTLADTSTISDVVDAVRHLVTGTLDPAYVGLSLTDASSVHLHSGDSLPTEVARRWNRYDRTATTPSALAADRGEMVLLPDPAAVAAQVPDAAPTFAEMGWQSGASVPLPGPEGPIGALTFVWKQPNPLDDTEQAVLAALAGYVAQALGRAGTLADRRDAASTMQKALLSPLPTHGQVRMAARYLPAHHADHVGGDWYDAIRIDEHRLALVIGDVSGHSIQAAAAMSQLRSILRTLLIDRRESPAAVLRRLEHTSRALHAPELTTAVLAYLDRTPTGRYALTWSNAGHPPPLLAVAGGGVVALDGGDPLLGAFRHPARRSQTVELPPGAVLVLHTDGLVETRTDPIDVGLDRVRELLRRHAADDPERIADTLVSRVGSRYEDDVALLVVSVP
ncbi:GAF domain-containing SpoIIE family protein phosphatase [Catenuloplanes atrovinosus]|uniref:Serine phosphatase RsbU (Regulator of sigma subunit) n=1 Tax=Catenuloplanes atrovinosus TaxID=137266 RepID=A0AAE3YQ35_9ACTN|nr:SpoIIE family protein phosphatase [Catenuloplanes atrovinosus]MDR7276511.1 serine phosphatase RsbU (regulator of sigma subunit) [Catenuloplanes atrovinosus]